MMENFVALLISYRPDSFLPLAAGMLVAGVTVLLYANFSGRKTRTAVQKRMRIEPLSPSFELSKSNVRKPEKAAASKTIKKAQEKAAAFYAKSDPESLSKLRSKLMQAGYLNTSAAGIFLTSRGVSLLLFLVLGFIWVHTSYSDDTSMRQWSIIIGCGGVGYFLPNLALWKLVKDKNREYRNGFPDFMDLMIVCADAGMSFEAAIERVSREIAATYPSLSENLQLLSIELRAGRALDDTMRSLSDRLGLDEVRSFATLLQQSRDLGTSLSGALRVFSDEMRHKRMSKAEEKAHSLPAKMAVPVTMCILPVVMLIAVIPIIVKMTTKV